MPIKVQIVAKVYRRPHLLPHIFIYPRILPCSSNTTPATARLLHALVDEQVSLPPQMLKPLQPLFLGGLHMALIGQQTQAPRLLFGDGHAARHRLRGHAAKIGSPKPSGTRKRDLKLPHGSSLCTRLQINPPRGPNPRPPVCCSTKKDRQKSLVRTSCRNSKLFQGSVGPLQWKGVLTPKRGPNTYT